MHPIFKKHAQPIYVIEKAKVSAFSVISGTPAPAKYESSDTEESSESSEDIGISEEQFWKTVDSLNWRDASDSVMNIVACKRKISSAYGFKQKLVQYAGALKNSMVSKGTDEKLLTDTVLSHIVGKGQIFYTATLEDPEFASYIIDGSEAQSLYDLL
jgi:hypothetical protein